MENKNLEDFRKTNPPIKANGITDWVFFEVDNFNTYELTPYKPYYRDRNRDILSDSGKRLPVAMLGNTCYTNSKWFYCEAPIDPAKIIAPAHKPTSKKETPMKTREISTSFNGTITVINGYDASKLTKDEAFEMLSNVEQYLKILTHLKILTTGAGQDTLYIKEEIKEATKNQELLVTILNDKNRP